MVYCFGRQVGHESGPRGVKTPRSVFICVLVLMAETIIPPESFSKMKIFAKPKGGRFCPPLAKT